MSSTGKESRRRKQPPSTTTPSVPMGPGGPSNKKLGKRKAKTPAASERKRQSTASRKGKAKQQARPADEEASHCSDDDVVMMSQSAAGDAPVVAEDVEMDDPFSAFHETDDEVAAANDDDDDVFFDMEADHGGLATSAGELHAHDEDEEEENDENDDMHGEDVDEDDDDDDMDDLHDHDLHDHDDENEDDDDDDDEEGFDALGLGHLRHAPLHLPDLFGGGLMSGSGQFRNILENLNNRDEPTQQLIALQELAETLSISSEENLLGLFPCDAFVKALVRIMKGPEMDQDMLMAIAMSTGDENPDISMQGGGNPELILLACRCLSNLLDVLPSAASSVVANDAITLLCDKLKSIQYIDLAEQALGALEKVASHVPRSVVQHQGISAALMYFDFFSIHSQRTALQTASHCMRNISSEALAQVVEIIPTLRNTLSYSDRSVVELTCLCWMRLSESYVKHRQCLEKVLSVDVLKIMLQLLPTSGNTNAVRQGAFNDLLRIFRAVSKASPTLGYELLKLDIVAAFYQILTGQLDLPDPEHPASLSLDTKWRDSTYTMLKIITDLLPPLPKDGPFSWKRFRDMEPVAMRTRSARMTELPVSQAQISPLSSQVASSSQVSAHDDAMSTTSSNAQLGGSAAATPESSTKPPDLRIQLLKDNPGLFERIGSTLFPLLLEIYSSSVHLRMRQLVTHLLVKMIYFMQGDILSKVLVNVPLSGFLVGLLAQQEHSTFVVDALYAAEFLLDKLPDVYVTLFHREGVYYEINDLARKPLTDETDIATPTPPNASSSSSLSAHASLLPPVPLDSDTNSESGRSQINTPSSSQEDGTSAASAAAAAAAARLPLFRSLLLSTHRGSSSRHHGSGAGHESFSASDGEPGIGHGLLRRSIIQLAKSIIQQYTRATAQLGDKNAVDTYSLQRWQQVAHQLRNGTYDLRQIADDMTTRGLSSFELLKSGLLDVLVLFLTRDDNDPRSPASPTANITSSSSSSSSTPLPPLKDRIAAFIDTFKDTMVLQDDGNTMAAPALALLVKRLQELFTRFERFDVVTPVSASSSSSAMSMGSVSVSDHHRNPVQWLAKNIRLRLSCQSPDVPTEFQQIILATQAIATFQVLEDYLLPRIDKAQRAKQLLQQLADTEDSDDDDDDMDDDELAEHRAARLRARAAAATSSAQASTSTATEETNWRIQFYINGQPVAMNATIYGALHRAHAQLAASSSSSSSSSSRRQQQQQQQHHLHQSQLQRPAIWTQANLVTYRRVPASEVEDTKKNAPQSKSAIDTPKLLAAKNSPCMKVLQLLQALVGLRQPWQDQDPNTKSAQHMPLVSPSLFVNRKLAAKMQRQLEEPLIVASACLPDWVYYFMDGFAFLFPFDVRYLYLQSTSFGYSRLITRWQNLHMRNNSQNGQTRPDGSHAQHRDHPQQHPMLGRLEKRKIMVNRDAVLASTVQIMNLLGNSPQILEIEYENEEGTGLGPTLEFYALASRAFCKVSTNMWRPASEHQNPDDLIDCPQGVFPAAISKRQPQKSRKKIIDLFKTLGQFVAKAMLDFRIIDIPFNTAFFKLLLQPNVDPASLIDEIDPVLGKSVHLLQRFIHAKQQIRADGTLSATEQAAKINAIEMDGAKLEDLCLDFTVPGQPDVELKRGGSHVAVTIHNIESYLQLLYDAMAGTGVQEQVNAFREGFNGLFAMRDLHVLTYQELVTLFGASSEDWSYATLADTIKADHGYTMESKTIKHLLEILSEMTIEERRGFLQFTTGSPRLPLGGWRAMRPMFTVVRKHCDAPLTPDDYLPSCMTCANYLKMPEYSSKAAMHKQLFKSIQEGRNSFLLS